MPRCKESRACPVVRKFARAVEWSSPLVEAQSRDGKNRDESEMRAQRSGGVAQSRLTSRKEIYDLEETSWVLVTGVADHYCHRSDHGGRHLYGDDAVV